MSAWRLRCSWHLANIVFGDKVEGLGRKHIQRLFLFLTVLVFHHQLRDITRPFISQSTQRAEIARAPGFVRRFTGVRSSISLSESVSPSTSSRFDSIAQN